MRRHNTQVMAYIALGTNEGDRIRNLQLSLDMLCIYEGIRPVRVSRIYETSPFGGIAKTPFLNAAVQIETLLRPGEILAVLHSIENSMGRKRRERWGNRIIDLDLIFFGDMVATDENLALPHPECANRDFVLRPIADISPDYIHPVLKRTVHSLLEHVTDRYILHIRKEFLSLNETKELSIP